MRRDLYLRFGPPLLISLLVILLLLFTFTSETSLQGSAVLVGAGDISSCDNDNDEATAKLLDDIPGTVFVLGDNVYVMPPKQSAAE